MLLRGQGFRAYDLELIAWGLGPAIRSGDLRVQHSGLRGNGPGFRVQGSGLRLSVAAIILPCADAWQCRWDLNPKSVST